MGDRITIFIDGSNFYHALREVHQRHDLDFEAFANYFVTDRVNPNNDPRVINPVEYYTALLDQKRFPKAFAANQRFLAHLNGLSNPQFKVTFGHMKHYGRLTYRCKNCGEKANVSTQRCARCGNLEMPEKSSEKGVDISLAVNMVEGAVNNVFDIAVLVSEDSDFVPAVEMVNRHGKAVELSVLKSATRKRGDDFKKVARYIHYVDGSDLRWRVP